MRTKLKPSSIKKKKNFSSIVDPDPLSEKNTVCEVQNLGIEAVKDDQTENKLTQRAESDDNESSVDEDFIKEEYLDDEEYLENSDSSLWEVEIQDCNEDSRDTDEFTYFEIDDDYSPSEEKNNKRKCTRRGKTKINGNRLKKTCTKKYFLSKSFHYKCDYCSLNFEKLKYLNDHKKTTHSDVWLTCLDCKKVFKSLKNLKQHSIIHENNGKKFVCEICSACFIERRRLNLHKLIHLEVKPIKCQICGKRFSHRSNYTRHLLIHSDVKPFICECGRNFSNSTKLKYHRVLHLKSKLMQLDT